MIRSLFVQLIPGYDISRTSLEEEIEGLFKPSRDLKFKWRPEMTRQPVIKVATKEVWLRLKELFKVDRIFDRDTTLMSQRRLKTTEVAMSI